MIPPEDLKIEILSTDRRGGQHVGYTSRPVRVTHIPTGVSATVEVRSQFYSREIAIHMIEAALTHPRF